MTSHLRKREGSFEAFDGVGFDVGVVVLAGAFAAVFDLLDDGLVHDSIHPLVHVRGSRVDGVPGRCKPRELEVIELGFRHGGEIGGIIEIGRIELEASGHAHHVVGVIVGPRVVVREERTPVPPSIVATEMLQALFKGRDQDPFTVTGCHQTKFDVLNVHLQKVREVVIISGTIRRTKKLDDGLFPVKVGDVGAGTDKTSIGLIKALERDHTAPVAITIPPLGVINQPFGHKLEGSREVHTLFEPRKQKLLPRRDGGFQ